MATNLTFAFNREEYNTLAAYAQPSDAQHAARILKRATELMKFKARYTAVQERTGIPALWYMVINERESASNFGTYLGNGQSLRRVTTLVPAGRGPFASWEDGAVDATTYDHVGRPGPEGWTWAWFLFKCEGWNGFGPRLHGRHTGYLWAGSQVYDTDPHGGGKYVADGVWDASAHDAQLGCYPLARAIVQLDPSLNLTGVYPYTTPWGVESGKPLPVVVKPEAQPEKLTGVRWLQDSLNKIQGAGLTVDGSYGRHTRAAVRRFQSLHSLSVDGQAGDLTCSAIDVELAIMPKSEGIPTEVHPTLPPASTVIDTQKGRSMDFTSIINLAQLVAPKFVPALGAVNPLLPVALDVLGKALGADGPHTNDTVVTAARDKLPDEVANAIKSAAVEYAKHVTGAATSIGVTVGEQVIPSAPAVSAPAAKPVQQLPSTGGVLMNTWIQSVLHVISGLGGIIAGSGLMDPNGPIAGLTAGRPVLGLLFVVASSLINHYMIKASNEATVQAGLK
jgi:lysozyme family protein/peptidoglycan hydrolase-like protein with peptidoglycan-binding domain